uniref:Uncharacterized protein n=1 Tax=Anguilla anguilla TaxID=7936 RepID=A0A0E9WPC3_ANGAN
MPRIVSKHFRSVWREELWAVCIRKSRHYAIMGNKPNSHYR